MSRVSAWLLVGAALALSGCPGRVPIVPPQMVTAEGLLEDVAVRRAATTSLKARARLRSGLAGVWAREAVVVRRPRDVRVDVLSPFGLALALGTNGHVLWAFPPDEGVRYEGPATPDNLSRFLGASVRVEDLVDILLGVPPVRELIGPPVLRRPDQDYYRIDLPHDEGVQALWFASDTLELERAEEWIADRLVLRVAFDDYRDAFPHAIDVAVPPTGVEANLRYVQVERNAVVDGSVFAPPPAPRALPIDSIHVDR